MSGCPECGSECRPTDLVCPVCGAHVPSPVPFVPVWEMVAITVLAPWAYYLSTMGLLILANAVVPRLVANPPIILAITSITWAWIAPFAILGLTGYYGYRRRTLARWLAVVLGWLLGGVLQVGICVLLSPFAHEKWKLLVCFMFGMAYAAVAVLVAAIGSAAALARCRERGG